MNLFVVLLFLICLLGSELVGAVHSDDWIRQLLAVAITTALVPALAFFQTSLLLHKFRCERFSYEAKQMFCRRMTISHSLAWLAASAAMIWALRWQDVVRGNWQLDRWPLIDEILILAPAVISMLASWAVFYELQFAINQDSGSTAPRDRKTNDGFHVQSIQHDWRSRLSDKLRNEIFKLQPRIDFVAIRFRVYFLMMLIPVGMMVLARDLAGQLVILPEPFPAIITIGGLGCLMLAFPFLMLFAWHNGPIENADLRTELLETCRQHRLAVFDIRTWRTGDQVINAAVAGWFPKLRIIFLSDGLLRRFERAEVFAVLRHEAGHIRLHHVRTRMFFLLVPWIVYLTRNQDVLASEYSSSYNAMLQPSCWLPILMLSMYGIVVTRWLSHQMEYEADLYSVMEDPTTRGNSTRKICDSRVEAMRSALMRLAALSPGELDRKTLLHPSLRARFNLLDRFTREPELAIGLQRLYARQRAVAIVVITMIAAASWIF